MFKPTDREETARFLSEFKACSAWSIVRRKAWPSLVEMGFTQPQCVAVLKSLSVEDYCSGPDLDRDVPGRLWVFGKEVLGQEMYIKVKVAGTGEGKMAVCLSFHPSRFPLCYPFRGAGESE